MNIPKEEEDESGAPTFKEDVMSAEFDFNPWKADPRSNNREIATIERKRQFISSSVTRETAFRKT